LSRKKHHKRLSAISQPLPAFGESSLKRAGPSWRRDVPQQLAQFTIKTNLKHHVYDEAGKEIEIHRHKGDFKEW
jgi:hypothetical protein